MQERPPPYHPLPSQRFTNLLQARAWEGKPSSPSTMKTGCFCFADGATGRASTPEPSSSSSKRGLRGSDFIPLPPASPSLSFGCGCDSSGLCALSLGACFGSGVVGDRSSHWKLGEEVVLSGLDGSAPPCTCIRTAHRLPQPATVWLYARWPQALQPCAHARRDCTASDMQK